VHLLTEFHNLTDDAVRGATKALYSNSANAEDNGTDCRYVKQFLIVMDLLLVMASQTNGSGSTFVSWNWLAANGTVSNTAGSITSTVSANTTSGFSIVSYTG
jgi:hypothetical protein